MIWHHGKAIAEALLFASAEPLPLRRLAALMGLDERDVRELVEELRREMNAPGRGLMLQEAAGGYQLVTRPEVAQYVEQLAQPRPSGLSHAALETLAIIAYRQPVTRAEVEALRGVSIDSALGTLLERRLVREVGRKEAPGRPILYGTTREFLLYFGLTDVADLPGVSEAEAAPDTTAANTDDQEAAG